MFKAKLGHHCARRKNKMCAKTKSLHTNFQAVTRKNGRNLTLAFQKKKKQSKKYCLIDGLTLFRKSFKRHCLSTVYFMQVIALGIVHGCTLVVHFVFTFNLLGATVFAFATSADHDKI